MLMVIFFLIVNEYFSVPAVSCDFLFVRADGIRHSIGW